jgi:hypothetical protein
MPENALFVRLPTAAPADNPPPAQTLHPPHLIARREMSINPRRRLIAFGIAAAFAP